MADLVNALNEVAGELRTATDPLTGDLARDSGARALQRSLSSLAGEIVMPSAGDGTPRTLADLGLATERNGTFRLDSKRLQATLARDPAGAAAMFTAGLFGVYATFDKLSRSATTTGNPGSLGGSIKRYQTQSTSVHEALSKLTAQQETLRANLVSRFSKADTRISAVEIHPVVPAGADRRVEREQGLMLAFTDPHEAIAAARSTRASKADAIRLILVRLCLEQAIGGLGLAIIAYERP
jgi:flagellar capping protein FliD